MMMEGLQLSNPEEEDAADRLREGKPVCDHCGGSLETSAGTDLRCQCGNLIARRRGRILEVKCRRCRRTVLLVAGGTESGG